MNEPVVDVDGHVTESTEPVAKYLDEPYRRRPLNFPFYPSDGWDRRLLGARRNWGQFRELAPGARQGRSIDEMIRNRGDITDTQKRKVLADNCRRLYGL